MAWNPNQSPDQNPNQGGNPGNDPYRPPQPQGPYQEPNYPGNQYGAPQDPYGAPPPQDPYGYPQNPYGQPQQGPYGYGVPEDPYAAYRGSNVTPKDTSTALKELPGQWLKVITRPSAITFAQEMGKATWPMVWIQLAILGVAAGVLGLINRLLINNTAATSSTLPSSGTGAAMRPILGVLQSPAFPASNFIIAPLFFLIAAICYFGMAKAFRGEGRFLTQVYTSLLFTVPLSIISYFLAAVPLLGIFAIFVIGIYEIVLQIFALIPVHRLSGGRATAVVLLIWLILFVVICALSIVLGLLMAASIRQ